MDDESSYKTNFILIDDEKVSESDVETDNNKQSNKDNNTLEKDFSFAPSELSLVKKNRKKIRIFDPEGIYDFRHIEIGYFYSLLHILSICISLPLILGSYYFAIAESQQVMPSLGEVSNLNMLDKLCMAFIVLYGFSKIKKVFTTKVTKFDIRYRIALCANSLNCIVLNHLKLLILTYAAFLMLMLSENSEKTVSAAFDIFLNGTLADTIAIISWFISIAITINAFKYCGKGEVS